MCPGIFYVLGNDIPTSSLRSPAKQTLDPKLQVLFRDQRGAACSNSGLFLDRKRLPAHLVSFFFFFFFYNKHSTNCMTMQNIYTHNNHAHTLGPTLSYVIAKSLRTMFNKTTLMNRAPMKNLSRFNWNLRKFWINAGQPFLHGGSKSEFLGTRPFLETFNE